MKKVLFVFPNEINGLGGGNIEGKKIYLFLKKLVQQRRIALEVISLDPELNEKSIVQAHKTVLKDVLARCCFHSSYFYIDWLRQKRYIFRKRPDIVVLSGSRLGFVARDIKNKLPKTLILSQFHNVELDYSRAYALRFGNFSRRLFHLLECLSLQRDEANTVKNTDFALFLTKRDAERVLQLYKVPVKGQVLPICLDIEDKTLVKGEMTPVHFVFLGSLDYPSNIEAIIWFVDHVWLNFIRRFTNARLIIGGSRPASRLLTTLEQVPNTIIYPNFRHREEIVPANSMFVSPIRHGAGMKVKVADALALGLGVIGSPETFIGYEEAINDPLNQGLMVQAEQAKDYMMAMEKIFRGGINENWSSNARALFEKYYSIDRTQRDLQHIFNQWL